MCPGHFFIQRREWVPGIPSPKPHKCGCVPRLCSRGSVGSPWGLPRHPPPLSTPHQPTQCGVRGWPRRQLLDIVLRREKHSLTAADLDRVVFRSEGMSCPAPFLTPPLILSPPPGTLLDHSVNLITPQIMGPLVSYLLSQEKNPF